MNNYFQNIFPKISGSQEDNQISIFGCPHSIFGPRGHGNFATLKGNIDTLKTMLRSCKSTEESVPVCQPQAYKLLFFFTVNNNR